jgi:hypothetical protein
VWLQVELCPGGATKRLTHDNVEEYIAAVVAARLAESRAQARAVRVGFNNVVPVGMLSLFAWCVAVAACCGVGLCCPSCHRDPCCPVLLLVRHEVDFLVCGSPVIDVGVLRRHTVLRGGLTMSHSLVRTFFQVLESFSQEERQLFLR